VKHPSFTLTIIIAAAISCFSAVQGQEKGASNAEAEKQYGLCCENFKNNNFDMAIKHGKQAVKLNNKNTQYYLMLGNAYMQKAQRVGKLASIGIARKCRRSWEKAVELDATNIEARMSLVGFYSMAPGIVGGGKDKARKQAATILTLDKTRGHLAYAMIYERENDFENCEKEYLAALELSEKKSSILMDLGMLYKQNKKFELAAKQFESVVKLDSTAIGAYYYLADNCLQSGEEYLQGIMHADFFIDNLKPNDKVNQAWGHLLKGKLYEKLQLLADARKAYQAALERNPDCRPAAKALKALK